MDIVMEKPERSPYWEARIWWLMENQPDLIRELFETNKELLKQSLSRIVADATFQEAQMLKQGIPEDAAREIAMDVVAPYPDQEPPLSLPKPIQKRILAWSRKLANLTHL